MRTKNSIRIIILISLSTIMISAFTVMPDPPEKQLYVEIKDTCVTAYRHYGYIEYGNGVRSYYNSPGDSIGVDTIRITRLYYKDTNAQDSIVNIYLDYVQQDIVGTKKGEHDITERNIQNKANMILFKGTY